MVVNSGYWGFVRWFLVVNIICKDLFGYSISFGQTEFAPSTKNPRNDTKACIGNAGLFFTITQ